MNIPTLFKPCRRQFLAGVAPVCALALGSGSALGMTPPQEDRHKFDKELDRKFSHNQLTGMRYQEFLVLARALEKEWGKKKLLAYLKKIATETGLGIGKNHAKSVGENSFASYVNTFRGPGYKDTLTMKIVEDTETAFEVKVTECVWAKVFLAMKAGDIGYSWVCHADYTWASGFNPKIKMIRDKTLMQGDACCNHRYVWEP